MPQIIKVSALVLAVAGAHAVAASGSWADAHSRAGRGREGASMVSGPRELREASEPRGARRPVGTVVAPPSSSTDGAALYNQYCAGCHGQGKRGASASSIQNAINGNKGGMGSLRSLTSGQISAIAGGRGASSPRAGSARVPVSVVPTSSTDGAALYNQYCAGCHGQGKRGASASQIQNAISGNKGGMGSLRVLTPAQLSAIAGQGGASARPPVAAPAAPAASTDGTALYAQYCAGCHGQTKRGASASRIQNAINSNTGGMGSLRSLTPAQVSAISGVGTGVVSPVAAGPATPVTSVPAASPIAAPVAASATSGLALYGQYCTGCHGQAKLGASASQIQNAINGNTGGMGSLRSLTPAQIAAIAAA